MFNSMNRLPFKLQGDSKIIPFSGSLKHPWNTVLLEKKIVAYLVNLPPIMESKDSLPFSKQPSVGLCFTPDVLHIII